ncbi:MAG TPA: haloacid dehalogenase-like hydrolase [Candidatus Angelobacter sp.]
MKTDTTLSPTAQQFVDSILALGPKLAVFDCDGTLWSGDSGADFFYWEIDRNLLPAQLADWALARYQTYLAGKVEEEVMCGEMVTINAGLRERLLEEEAEEFFASVVAKRIFPEMLQLTHALAGAGCELWAVSSTNLWSVRAGVKRFGIPAENVLAASVHVEQGRATDRLVRVPSGPAKATAIHEVVGRPVDACLGNSIHDLAMLEMARHSVAVNPNADLEAIAKKKAWRIYWPEGTR